MQLRIALPPSTGSKSSTAGMIADKALLRFAGESRRWLHAPASPVGAAVSGGRGGQAGDAVRTPRARERNR
jgi:hypothetical protein